MAKEVKSSILLLNDVVINESFHTEEEASLWIKSCFASPTGKIVKSWEIIGKWMTRK
jgi:hypothetical protein